MSFDFLMLAALPSHFLAAVLHLFSSLLLLLQFWPQQHTCPIFTCKSCCRCQMLLLFFSSPVQVPVTVLRCFLLYCVESLALEDINAQTLHHIVLFLSYGLRTKGRYTITSSTACVGKLFVIIIYCVVISVCPARYIMAITLF